MSNPVFALRARFIRPANTTQYTASDLVANSATAADVVPMAFNCGSNGAAIMVRRVRVAKTGTSLTTATFRVHLFNKLPVPTVGDNGVWDNSNVLATDDARYLAGTFDVTVGKSGVSGSSGQGVSTTGSDVILSPFTGDLVYGILSATGAYTPTSGEDFEVVLECVR